MLVMRLIREQNMVPHNCLLEVRNLKKYFPVRKGVFKRTVGSVKAVDDINLHIRAGETLGLVGESGCGKTTAGWTILHMLKPTSGEVIFRSRRLAQPGEEYKELNVVAASRKELKNLRRDMQIIFQDPYSSLNPRMTVGAIVGEPLFAHKVAQGAELKDRVEKLLLSVGLKSNHMNRFPHEFSGGQRQRIMIARALSLGPQIIIADEPISALDVSIQAQVLNLLIDLQSEFSLTYLFIAHDLSAVRHISNRVAVMYLGKIVEVAETDELFLNPKHPYTEALISAVPVPNPHYKTGRIHLEGDVPSPLNPPSGCYFHPRCRYAKNLCRSQTPIQQEMGKGHYVICHRAESLSLQPIWTG
jgi:peptide/nickel transport system ATP-binding protein